MTALGQLLDRAASDWTALADGVRRLRYRYAELERLPVLDGGPARSSSDEIAHWKPAMRLGGRSCPALVCPPDAAVAYDVVLPPGATIVSRVAVAPPGDADAIVSAGGDIVFEIRVRAAGLDAAARKVVSLGGPGDVNRRWQRLRLRAPGAGPARITLATTAQPPVPPGASSNRALWGSPRVESRRSVGQLISAVRATVSDWGVRGALQKTLSTSDRLYRSWVHDVSVSRGALRAQREWAQSHPQTLSLITFVPTANDRPRPRTAKSLLAQSYPHWEWILVGPETSLDGGSGPGAPVRDKRVRVVHVPAACGRAEAWNQAVLNARGQFVALLDTDDALSPSALYEMATILDRTPDCDLAYSDEDRVPLSGWRRHEPHFKPEWSPDYLLSGNYVGRLAVMRRQTVLAVGGFRSLYDGAEEWDLLLRLSRLPLRAKRVPECLYHRVATASASPSSAAIAALEDHCRQLGLSAAAVSVTAVSLTTVSATDSYRVVWPVRDAPLVSIVIPNRNAAAVITPCVRGLLEHTRYPRRELVIVDNGSTDPAVLTLYRLVEDQGGVIVPFNQPFNFSEACNAGAAAARGDLLLFLNNDVEVIDPGWLEELVRWAQLPAVGVVGAKLLYPDRTIQHAGVVFGIGLVGHIFARGHEHVGGLFGSPDCYRNYLGVTGACQMMRRQVFDELGGFDSRFRLSFSDIVLCMEAWKAGYRVVYTPYARLVHHESYTRKREDWPEDLQLLVEYLEQHAFVEDPYFHPELDARSPIPRLRPPFGGSPRQAVRDYMDRVLAGTTGVR